MLKYIYFIFKKIFLKLIYQIKQLKIDIKNNF